MNTLKIKNRISKLIKQKDKFYFVDSILQNGKLFDIGCGNNSPYRIKTLRPDIYYVGIDIEIDSQSLSSNKYADEFILTDASNFYAEIAKYPNTFDSVISSHNLEHCNDYQNVTLAMINSLKLGGTIYISFPCEESAKFPSRKGTLNFYDDDTHRNLINYKTFISLLNQNGMDILFATKRNRPFIPFILGFLFEPFSRLLNKQVPLGATWAFFGFETIIIAKKREANMY